MKPIIKIKDLSVIYNQGEPNEVRALSNINLEIFPREYVIIFGPSGCGKSTLLYAIAGLEQATKGSVEILDKNITDFDVNELATLRRQEFGFIFQAYNLIPTLSVANNIILPQLFQGEKRRDAGKQTSSLLERFGIAEQAKKMPTELSGGQQQRVGVARSLINDPEVILADEPIGNLDSQSAKNVILILENLNQEDKKTIILVTHEPQYLDYAHRIIHMKDGSITWQVVNHVKKQIGSGFAGGAVEDLARAHPHLSESRLKAKSLIHHLFEVYEEPEFHRLEKIVDKYLAGEINKKELELFLDKSFDEGGLGLYKQTAQSLAKQIQATIEISKQIQKKAKGLSTTLLNYIIKDSDITLTPLETRKLDSAIKKRLANTFDKQRFEKFLDAPEKQGGVGLNSRTAHNFSRRLEALLVNYNEVKNS